MQPALPSTDKGHVAHPYSVWGKRSELTPQQIRRCLGCVVMFYGQPEAAFALSLDTRLFA